MLLVSYVERRPFAQVVRGDEEHQPERISEVGTAAAHQHRIPAGGSERRRVTLRVRIVDDLDAGARAP